MANGLARRRSEFSFTIDVRPPFRLDLTVWALRRRSVNETDQWDGNAYRRTIHVGETPVGLAVTQVGRPEAPKLSVRVSGDARHARAEAAARRALGHLLGLDLDLTAFYAVAAAEPPLDGQHPVRTAALIR